MSIFLKLFPIKVVPQYKSDRSLLNLFYYYFNYLPGTCLAMQL